MRIVVIGGGAAGASAASRAKRVSPHSEVYLIEETSRITHAPCGIPYAIGGLSQPGKLFVYNAEEFEKERNIRVLINTTVKDIDIDKKIVTLTKNGNESKLKYDKLVIASGAKPIKPRIDGIDSEGVETIRHPALVDRLINKIDMAKHIIVIGGGYIGLEVTENLLRLNKKIILIERMSFLLEKTLDVDVAKLVTEEVRKKDVDLRLNESLLEIEKRNEKLIVTTDKNQYIGDLVILAIGVIPNSDLAEKAGIPLGVNKAIKVNEFMETDVVDVYAAGDVAEKYHKILKEKTWIPLAPTANKEGYVAGTNTTVREKIVFPGIIGTSITKFDEFYIARTGLTEKEAMNRGIKVKSKLIKHHTKAHYYPGGKDVFIKLIVRSSDDVIIGAQAAGFSEIVSGYIDILSIAIDKSMSVEELFFSDLSYMPATAPVWHPLITAARVLMKD